MRPRIDLNPQTLRASGVKRLGIPCSLVAPALVTLYGVDKHAHGMVISQGLEDPLYQELERLDSERLKIKSWRRGTSVVHG